MIITLSGVPGSGKTSAGKLLAERLGFPFYSMGALRAKLAEERGVSIDELNKIGEQDPTTDTSVDDYQRELGKTLDNFIVEGRLSWYFIPHSFKIFLDCEMDEAAHRIFLARKAKGDRVDEPDYLSEEDVKRTITRRIASDVLRYKTIYGVDYRDRTHYDLIIDTSKFKGPEDTAYAIINELKARGMLN